MPYSALISKIRIHNPNKKGSRAANRNYLTYIATREGVDITEINDINDLLKNDSILGTEINDDYVHQLSDNESYLKYMAKRPRSHGLFGNIDTSDLNEVARNVANLTKEKRLIYRGIINIWEKDAEELGYTDKEQWNLYLKRVLPDIAKELGVSPTNFSWVAAYHAEKSHPHVHFELWDNNKKVKNPFIHVSVQHKCRKILSDAMFSEEYENMIKEVYRSEREELNQIRNNSRRELTESTKEFMSDLFVPGKKINSLPDRISIDEIAVLEKEIIKLAGKLPEKGSVDYAYLQPNIKHEVDNISSLILQRIDMSKEFSSYIKAVEDGQKLIGKNKFEISISRERAEKDIYKRIGNIIVKRTKEVREYSNSNDLKNEEDLKKRMTENFSAVELNVEQKVDNVDELNFIKLYNAAGDIGYIKVNNNISEDIFEANIEKVESNIYYESKKHESIINDLENEKLKTYINNKDDQSSIFHEITSDDYIYSDEKFFFAWNKNYKKALDYLYNSEKQDFSLAFKLLTEEAKNKNVLAIHDLGKIYEKGIGRDINLELSEEFYKKAFNGFLAIEREKPQKYIEYRIGKLYEAGRGITQSYPVALKWYVNAARQGHKYAQYSLGMLYLHSKGTDPDLDKKFYQKEAMSLFQMSAEQGNAYASFEAAKILEKGLIDKPNINAAQKNYEEAFKGFLAMLEQREDDNLLYRVGKMYYEGLGTEKSEFIGIRYLEKAAKLNNINAQYALAKIYIKLEDSKINEAIEWLMKLAEADHDMAQYSLGKIYLEGKYIDKNIDEAINLLNRSAEKGSQFAQYQLGKMYYKGEDVSQDISKAIEFLVASADQENDYAQYTLGKIFSDKEAYYYNIQEALTWYEKSTDRGNQFAQYQLGRLYYKGEEVELDISKAVNYLMLSALQENDFAEYTLGKIYSDKEAGYYNIHEALTWYEKAADKRNQFAQYQLGRLYYKGEEVDRDMVKAFEYLLKSAEQGNDFAEYTLGKIYSDKEAGYYNIQEALTWYEKAADKGNQIAQYQLGRLYYIGEEIDREMIKAFEYLLKSAEQGNDFAEYTIGKIYADKEAGNYNIHEALTWYEKAADKRNQFAQYQLGRLYYKGEEVDRDMVKAFEYLLKSAEQGNDFAEYTIGKIYADKEAGNYNIHEALTWYEKAADKGNQFAQYQLGRLYYKGEEVDRDMVKAFEYLLKSAEQENDFAEYTLGKIYSDVELDNYDIDAAVVWYEKAAVKGNQFAQYQLGKMYYEGILVDFDYDLSIKLLLKSAEQNNDFAQYYLGKIYTERNIDLAISWYTKAAEQGNQFAQFQLGNMYLWGKKIPQNEELGYYWLNKAVEQGNEYALQSLEAYQNFQGRFLPGVVYGMVKSIFTTIQQQNYDSSWQDDRKFRSKSKQAKKEDYLHNRYK